MTSSTSHDIYVDGGLTTKKITFSIPTGKLAVLEPHTIGISHQLLTEHTGVLSPDDLNISHIDIKVSPEAPAAGVTLGYTADVLTDRITANPIGTSHTIHTTIGSRAAVGPFDHVHTDASPDGTIQTKPSTVLRDVLASDPEHTLKRLHRWSYKDADGKQKLLTREHATSGTFVSRAQNVGTSRSEDVVVVPETGPLGPNTVHRLIQFQGVKTTQQDYPSVTSCKYGPDDVITMNKRDFDTLQSDIGHALSPKDNFARTDSHGLYVRYVHMDENRKPLKNTNVTLTLHRKPMNIGDPDIPTKTMMDVQAATRTPMPSHMKTIVGRPEVPILNQLHPNLPDEGNVYVHSVIPYSEWDNK